MQAALSNLKQLDETSKIAILGDMFELGNESVQEHKKIVEFLEKEPSIKAFVIGKDFYKNKKTINNIMFFETFEDFKINFMAKPHNSLILIKGSRGMALEKALDLI